MRRVATTSNVVLLVLLAALAVSAAILPASKGLGRPPRHLHKRFGQPSGPPLTTFPPPSQTAVPQPSFPPETTTAAPATPAPPGPPVDPCDGRDPAEFPFCDTSLSIDERADALIQMLPVDQFATLLGNTAGEVNASNGVYLPAYQWWSEGLHGVADSPGVNYGGRVPATTSFPQVCTTGASWDRDLFTAIGDTVGKEGRAMNNVDRAGLTYWAPNINIYRDPRWGRGQETPGEDPYLTSVYAMHFVRAMQNNTMDPTRLRVSSCCKHFAMYDLEDWGGYDRFSFNAVVSEYDMANTFLPPFEACQHAEGGAASGTMCSYNAVNGIPMCANPMITTVARQEFGFNGYVTSDCGATRFVQEAHHYTNSTWETITDVFKAGEDIDCDDYIQSAIANELKNGTVSVNLTQSALKELFKVQLRLGMFDPAESQPYKKLGPHDIDTTEARLLAYRAASEGIVLLENINHSLPLVIGPQLRKVAVLGPNAASKSVMLGNYYGQPPYTISVLEGVKRYESQGITVKYAAGLPSVTSEDVTGFDEACQAANSSDVSILVVGNDQSVEAEGNDRESIAFPGAQDLFVKHMMGCSSRPVIVVTLSGGSVDYSPWNQDPRLGGLLWAGYPGQSGGVAIADILFGTVSPSGRLPHTVYPSSYADQVMMTNMRMESDPNTGYPGRTYRYFVGEPVYPFGWMQTYTIFNVTILSEMKPEISASRDIAARDKFTLPMTTPTNSLVMNISNVGAMKSGVSLVLKITSLNPGLDIGGTVTDFQRIELAPGQSTIVTLYSHLHSSLNNPTAHPKDRSVRLGAYRWSLLGKEFAHLSGQFTIVE